MSRTVIQIGADQVAYDGQQWTSISGERSRDFADLMKVSQSLYELQARSHPDFAYNVARAAAEDWGGEIIEYQPDTAAIAPGRIY